MKIQPIIPNSNSFSWPKPKPMTYPRLPLPTWPEKPKIFGNDINKGKLLDIRA